MLVASILTPITAAPYSLTASNYRSFTPFSKQIDPTGTLRIDHRFSDKASIYGRLTRVYWILERVALMLDKSSKI
jgi:hypothetical protein